MESAKLINRKLENLDEKIPVFLTGDFNFTPDSKAYREIISGQLSDSKKVSASPPYGPEGTFNGFQVDQTPLHRIDYIFVNQKINVLGYGVLTDSKDQRYPSDHLPVIVFAEFSE